MQNQTASNIDTRKDQAQRKRFDSVASPPTSHRPQPPTMPLATARARPDLRSDCWNSPLCPRNMAAAGTQDSLLPPDCGPAKAHQSSIRTTAAITEICSPGTPLAAPPTQDSENQTRTKRLKLNSEEPLSDSNDNISNNNTTTIDTATSKSPTTTTSTPDKRLPHHIIERRYRENLNTSIEHLRAAVPTTTSCLLAPDMEDLGSGPSSSTNNNSGGGGIRPMSKAAVIAHAAEYMRAVAAQNEEVERANREMRVTVEALRRLVNCEDCGVVQRIVDAGGGGGC